MGVRMAPPVAGMFSTPVTRIRQIERNMGRSTARTIACSSCSPSAITLTLNLSEGSMAPRIADPSAGSRLCASVHESFTVRRRAARPLTTPRPASAAASIAASAVGVSRSSSSAARVASSAASPGPARRHRASRARRRRGDRRANSTAVDNGATTARADRSSIVTFSEVADEHEIAGRLRHLAPIAMHHRLVQPMPDERLARDRFGLSSARLVVREEEIDTTAMEVDRGSQLTQGEGAAFDVPTRPATPHRASHAGSPSSLGRHSTKSSGCAWPDRPAAHPTRRRVDASGRRRGGRVIRSRSRPRCRSTPHRRPGRHRPG